MAITKPDAVLEAIQDGKTNDEIRDEIDGRLSDKRLDKLRKHPNIRGGSGMDEERVNNPEREKEEIEREVEKIFSPDPVKEIGCKVICDPEISNRLSIIEQTTGCDPRIKRPITNLRQTGAEYKGLLDYYVDGRVVVFWADGIEIDSDQLDQLLEEIKEIVRIHKEFAKA